MIWLVGLVIVIIVGIGGTIYLSCAISRFGLIQKASGEKKWLSRLIAFAVLLAGFALFAVLLSVTDAIVILLHLLFFFLVFGLFFRIAGKGSGKRSKTCWQG